MNPRIRFGDKHFHLPRSRALRVTIGMLLVIFGVFGFLPVVGFWMIPLGLLVLSVDLPVVRRWRRRLVVWWERRRRPEAAAEAEPKDSQAPPPGGATP